MNLPATSETALIAEVRQLIDAARTRAAAAVNAELTWLYWQVGRRIHREVLGRHRAEYGEEIVSALRRQLSWTHLKALIYVDNPLKRDFYVELCRLEGWSSRQLHERMQSLLFERSAISKQSNETIRHDIGPSPVIMFVQQGEKRTILHQTAYDQLVKEANP